MVCEKAPIEETKSSVEAEKRLEKTVTLREILYLSECQRSGGERHPKEQ